jgi:hypothetical protein
MIVIQTSLPVAMTTTSIELRSNSLGQDKVIEEVGVGGECRCWGRQRSPVVRWDGAESSAATDAGAGTILDADAGAGAVLELALVGKVDAGEEVDGRSPGRSGELVGGGCRGKNRL